MAEMANREHYVPIARRDLVDLLCGPLAPEPARSFRRLADLVAATFHFEYHHLFEKLKDAYHPFDPDREQVTLRSMTPDQRAQTLETLYTGVVQLMQQANFTRLSADAIREATSVASEWGVNMDVDFSLFERLDLFVRGDSLGKRYLRRWYSPWRRRTIHLPTYQRLVLLVKLKPSPRLPHEIDTSHVFLKFFKDIPKVDLEMLLPGARLRMPGLSRLKLGGSLLGSGGWVGYTVIQEVISSGLGTPLVLGPLAAVAGYGYKQYFGYQSTKNAFSLRLAQSLYYQTLSNNQGVLAHLLDEAEEQECREALLAYFHLWQHPDAQANGWSADQLDAHIEADLEARTGITVDFEIDDALAKLVRLKLATEEAGRYRAVPIDAALAALDHAWDNYFSYNRVVQE